MLGFARIRRLALLGDNLAGHRLRVKVAYDFDTYWEGNYVFDSTMDDASPAPYWGIAEQHDLDGGASTREDKAYLLQKHTSRQKCTAVRLQISDEQLDEKTTTTLVVRREASDKGTGSVSGGEDFGWSVDISAAWAVVGAEYKEEPDGVWDTYPGAAYVYKYEGGTWVEKQKLAPDTPTDAWAFGCQVAISADGATIAIGEAQTVAHTSRVYVFRRSGDVWAREALLTGSDSAAGDWFGSSISQNERSLALSEDGNVLAVTAVGDDPNGSLYIFTRSGVTWTQAQKIAGPEAGFGYGVSVSNDGDVIAVGFEDVVDRDPKVYRRASGTWSLEGTLSPTPDSSDDDYGRYLCLNEDGDEIVVGSYSEDYGAYGSMGTVYFFTESGGAWSQAQRVEVPAANQVRANINMGWDVSMAGNIAIAGAHQDKDAGDGAGAWGSFYLLQKRDLTWSVVERVYPQVVGQTGRSLACCRAGEAEVRSVVGTFAEGSGGKGAVRFYSHTVPLGGGYSLSAIGLLVAAKGGLKPLGASRTI